MAVKNRLKDYLNQNGIKQIWLAEQVGVTRGTIGNIVNHKYTPTLDLAFKICITLDCNIDFLFYYEKDVE
jgi:putative transcriptional regulator